MEEKLITNPTDYWSGHLSFFEGYLLLMLAVVMLIAISATIAYVLDRKNRKYRKSNFKPGDSVTFIINRRIKDAEILEINGDEFTIKTKINRSDLFLKKSREK